MVCFEAIASSFSLLLYCHPNPPRVKPFDFAYEEQVGKRISGMRPQDYTAWELLYGILPGCSEMQGENHITGYTFWQQAGWLRRLPGWVRHRRYSAGINWGEKRRHTSILYHYRFRSWGVSLSYIWCGERCVARRDSKIAYNLITMQLAEKCYFVRKTNVKRFVL